MAKRRAAEAAEANVIPPESYDDATVQALMEEAARYLDYPMYGGGSVRPPALTVPVLYAGYFQTVAYITCQEPQHRAFMTSVLRYQRQMQRRGILSFLQVHTMRAYRLHTWVSTAETVSWCIAVIQSVTLQSIRPIGRAILCVWKIIRKLKLFLSVRNDDERDSLKRSERTDSTALQAKEKDLAEQKQMAEDAEAMKIIRKYKISSERLQMLNKLSEDEVRNLLQKREQEKEVSINEKQEIIG